MNKLRVFKFRINAKFKANGNVINDLLVPFYAYTIEQANKLLHEFCEMNGVEILKVIRTIII